MLHEYGQIPGPLWTDACEHKPGSYVCSFKTIDMVNDQVRVTHNDLYAYQHHSGHTYLCIRYGNEPSSYLSPTSIIRTAESAHLLGIYSQAVNLLNALGNVTWKRKQPKPDPNSIHQRHTLTVCFDIPADASSDDVEEFMLSLKDLARPWKAMAFHRSHDPHPGANDD